MLGKKKFIGYKESIYQATCLSKFINKVATNGLQSKVERLLYKGFFFIKKLKKIVPLLIFCECLEKIHPLIGLQVFKSKSRKKKQSVVIPILFKSFRRYNKALSWLVTSIKLRKEKYLWDRIIHELFVVLFFNAGDALKKKKEYYQVSTLFKAQKNKKKKKKFK
jgi:ribosomal protein S7